MKTIWKYELELKDEQWIEMPDNYEILCVQVQRGIPCIWVLVDDYWPKVHAKIIMAGTGYPFKSSDYKYIGSCQIYDETLIFHVFEELK